jgi:TrpR-related protein YerC/YecD
MLDLYTAFSLIKDKKEFDAFLTDLCTPDELRNLNTRWRIAQNLYEGKISQHDLSRKSKYGLATISRVSRCLFRDPVQGYKNILDRASKKI